MKEINTNYSWTEEHEIRENTVRKFAKKNIKSYVREIDTNKKYQKK